MPIAQFHKSRLDDPDVRTPATLYLTPRAVEVQEFVVFMFLVLEKGRRERERSEGGLMQPMGSGTTLPHSGGY